MAHGGIPPESARLISQLFFEEDAADRITFALWDYGGQHVFYALHHILLSRLGVHVCVFDMEAVRDKRRREQALADLSFWLDSVKIHAAGAPVILVGTRKDRIRNPQQWHGVDQILRERFAHRGLLTSVQATPNVTYRVHDVTYRAHDVT